MKVALVTNGAAGAGPEITARLSGAGYRVVPVETSDESGRGALGRAVAAAGTDGIDVLVVNGRPAPTADALDAGPTWFAAAIDAGLNECFSACREAARRAVEHGRRLTIVNVRSALAEVGLPGRAGEASVAAAVLAMTKALAVEWGGFGIRVVAVLVGPDPSPLGDQASIAASIAASIVDVQGVVPLGARVTEADVAAAVAFLVSADADRITGQAIVVDAGWLADGWREESRRE